MILLDYNHIFLASIFAQPDRNEINEELVRHVVLSCTLSYKRKYSEEYGNIVFCADGKENCWRKSIFPYYKLNRKRNREKSSYNWSAIFDSLNKIREELIAYMPYKFISINNAEADDIIATICKRYHDKEPILILSGDKDFIQLQRYPGIKQYSPVQKKYVTHDDPVVFLKEKILRGDDGDGVPNFLSDSDTFANPDKRQKPLTEKRIIEYMNKDISEYDENLKLNYARNEKLVDLINAIPEQLELDILQEFECIVPSKNKIMTYFMKAGLKNLMSNISEF